MGYHIGRVPIVIRNTIIGANVMPLYGYACQCGFHKDVLHSISSKESVKCDKCGQVMTKQFSAPAVNFGGADWKNDWKKKNK